MFYQRLKLLSDLSCKGEGDYAWTMFKVFEDEPGWEFTVLSLLSAFHSLDV